MGWLQIWRKSALLAIAISFAWAPKAPTSDCAPVPTRPQNSVNLVHFAVGRDRVAPLLAACGGLPVDARSKFAEATLLAVSGELDAASTLLQTPNGYLSDAAKLLAADILTEQRNPEQLTKAIELYQQLAVGGSADAEQGLGIALLRASHDGNARRRAIDILEGLANKGVVLARAQLGAALFQTGTEDQERKFGLAFLEQASMQGSIAAKLELAKIFMAPGPMQDEERAVLLLGPSITADVAEAQHLSAVLWKDGWNLSTNHSEDLRAEAKRNHDHVEELFQRAQVTGDFDQATKEQGKQIRRLREIVDLLAEHRDASKARELFLAAASKGYLPAIVGAGTLLAFHPVEASELPIGVQYLEQAFARGDASAAERLAVLHEFGIGKMRPDLALQYYTFAAQKGSARAILALDRLKGSWSEPWTREMTALKEFVVGLGLQSIDRLAKASRIFGRGLPDDAPYFEADRWVTFRLHRGDGIQVFGSNLNQGERVRLSAGDRLEVTRLGELDRAPLGRIVDKGRILAIIRVGDDFFTPAVETFPPSGTDNKPVASAYSETEIVFRALSGPDNAISINDPNYDLFQRSTTFPGTAPYGDALGQLQHDVEVRIPAVPRVTGVIRGGTSFEIVRGSQLLLRERVPDGSNLYLDFHPSQLLQLLSLSLPRDIAPLPSEIERDWIERPNPALLASGFPIGWLYRVYRPSEDGLFAAMVEVNPPVVAMNAEAKDDFKKSFRLRIVGFHLSLVRHGGVSLESLLAKASLAHPLARLGRLDEAIRLREEVVKSLQAFDVRPPTDLVWQLSELANLYSQQGDMSRAIIAGRQALALATQLSDEQRPELGFPHPSVQRTIGQLSRYYNSVGDFDRAYIYRQQLSAFDLVNDPEGTTNGDMETYLSIADLALRQGRRDISIAAARHVLPKAKADAGQRDKPEPIPRPVTMPDGIVAVFGPPERSSKVGQALYRLGEAYWVSGTPWSYAEPVFEAANISGMGSTGPGTDLTMTSAARLAMVRWIMGKDDRTLELLKRSIGFGVGTNKYPNLKIIDHDTQLLFHAAYLGTLDWYRNKGLIDDHQLFEEASSLFAAIEESDPFALSFKIADLKRHLANPFQAEALREWTDATAEYDRIVRQLNAVAEGKVARPIAEVDEARQRSESASRRVSQAQAALEIAFPEAPMLPSQASDFVASLQRTLDSDEVIVDLLPTRYTVHALVITKDSRRVASYAITDVDLVNKIKKMRAALDPNSLKISSAGERVYSTIDTKALQDVRPFTLDLLGAEGRAKRRWIVVAHDILRNIPLEAVPLSDSVSNVASDVSGSPESWPGLSKEIAYLPSLSSILVLRSGTNGSQAPDPVTVIADPIMPNDPRYNNPIAAGLSNVQDWLRQVRWTFGNWLGGEAQLEPVPETGALGFEVLNELGGNIERFYSGWRARRETITNTSGLEKARVILFATHGETADSYPALAEPFLVLTPREDSTAPFDPLTASEISSLNLDAELVILSACDTAAPDGTPGRAGFSGLAQSFITAGARSLVVTQWAIKTGAADSAVTTTLKAGLRSIPPGESLRIGRLEVAKRLGHPSYWSAFAYIGDPARPWQLRH